MSEVLVATNQNKKFSEALSNLNDAQRKAVETIEGPVLVIAGPGTGKTQILAARVGNILLNTHIYPENILCLTYTDAGTIAMRTRLQEFIGPQAYRIPIHTFHSFCNQIIQENLDRFGMNELNVITEIEEAELFRELIDSFDKDHRLKRWSGEVYYEAVRLQNLFSMMKRENLTPEILTIKVNECIEELKNNPENISTRGKNKGELKADVQKKIDSFPQLIAAAYEFPKYEELLRKRKRYTYDDMILWVLTEFKNDPQFLLRYQERFHYFLVDEYQDTSGSQNEVLDLLTSFWEVPNVFVVGDDDQSIFRFQGASVENIRRFVHRYESNLSLISLEENYRSSQPILNVSTQLIQNNEERLINEYNHFTKDLVARNQEYGYSPPLPRLLVFDTPKAEAAYIAAEIEKLKKEEIPLSEIAILYRLHRHVDDLAECLRKKNIPINIRLRENILQLPLTTRLLNLLEYIDKESRLPGSGENLLFTLLHYDFFEINISYLHRLSLCLPGKRVTWREAISQPAKYLEHDLFSGTAGCVDSLMKISKSLEKWIGLLRNVSLQTFFQQVITEGGILKRILNKPDKIWLLQELDTLFNFIKDESRRHPTLTLRELIIKVRLMQQENMRLQINKFTYEPNAVNLITAHSAKGLEFQYVFLMSCNSRNWERHVAPWGNEYYYPKNLITETPGEPVEEERRLFYVAMTRAKEFLTVSYSKHDAAGNDLEKSRFVAEIEDHPEIVQEAGTPSVEEIAAFTKTVLSSELHPPKYPSDENYIRKLLENYVLNVTGLSAYLKCPLTFYYQKLLRIPSANEEYMAFGGAVHEALEDYFKSMATSGTNTFGPFEELVERFNHHMNRKRGIFSDEQFERRMEYGDLILSKYHAQYIDSWNRIISLERKLSGIEIEGVPVNGRIDKIEFDGKNAMVVDYKTGKFENSKSKFRRPGEGRDSFELQYGGDYWRQAVFYKLLIDNYKLKNWNVVSCEFDFIEPNKDTGEFIKQKIDISDQDIRIVKHQLTTAWQGIQQRDFHGCEEKDCDWCNFVRSNFSQALPPDDMS
jgi:DNA helicase-2/ATP-dependent DNA helicase PcrA